MEYARSCRKCRFAIRFCPCCGTALGGKNGNASRYHHHVGGSASPFSEGASFPRVAADRAEDSRSSVPWNHTTAAWRQRLPRRPVSAYEVYLASVYGITGGNDDKEEEADAAAAGATKTSHSRDPAAAGAHQPPREARAAAALSWLRMASADKCIYEQEAQAWRARLDTANTAHTAVPVAGSATVLSSSAEVTAPKNVDGGLVGDPSVPLALSFPGQSLCPEQKVPHIGKKVRSAKHTSEVHLPRSSTSFALFRTSMKGKQKMNMREVACMWRHMSAEDKAPFDAAAAAKRTERFLAQTNSYANDDPS